MSHPEARSARFQPGRRELLGARWAAPSLIAALVVGAIALAGCTTSIGGVAGPRKTSVTVIATASPAEPTATNAPLRDMRGYRLVFDEEFSGAQLDGKKWTPSLPWGNVNRAEQQVYVPQALRLSDGLLTITASKSPAGGRPYSSGAICTEKRFDFKYGYAEMRAQVPKGAGLWSAFWLLRREKDSNDEADIVEVLGSDPTSGFTALHYGTTLHKEVAINMFRGSDLSAGFHTFALRWDPGVMVWLVDGVERFRATQGVPTKPMIVIANLAVGGRRSWSGAPDPTTVFPAHCKIDYIRVWQRK